jgi:hypothetical protein
MRDPADYNKPSSFLKLAYKQYKYTLRPDVARDMRFRVLPTFISIKVNTNSLNALYYPGTITSYFLNKMYAQKGFDFKITSNNGQCILYKRGLTRHTSFEYQVRNKPYIFLEEINGNGEIYLTFDYATIGLVAGHVDNYQVTFKTPKESVRADLDSVTTYYKLYNYIADLSFYLPDMGNYIQ